MPSYTLNPFFFPEMPSSRTDPSKGPHPSAVQGHLNFRPQVGAAVAAEITNYEKASSLLLGAQLFYVLSTPAEILPATCFTSSKTNKQIKTQMLINTQDSCQTG